MTGQPRNYLAIPLPGHKGIAIIFTAIAATFLVILISLAAMPMKVTNGDCGTVFASSDTWTYDSNIKAANDFARKSVRSSADLDRFASNLVDNMMSDLAFGSAVHDQCKERHETRLTWIVVVGITAAIFVVGAIHFGRQHRRVTSSNATPSHSANIDSD